MPVCCGRTFDANGIRNHLDNAAHHANEIECRWCYRRWRTHDDRARRQHEEDEHWLQCQQCDVICPNQEEMDDHVEENHPANYCYGCQRRFQGVSQLRAVCIGVGPAV